MPSLEHIHFETFYCKNGLIGGWGVKIYYGAQLTSQSAI